MAQKELTTDQIQKIEQFMEGRTTLVEAEVTEFITSNSLPWESAAAFRMWVKANGYWNSEGTAIKASTKGPSVKGIQSFGENTDAMSTADILLQDPEKAISGAISQLEEEIGKIQLEAEQQISIIKSAAEEKVAARKDKIEQLRKVIQNR